MEYISSKQIAEKWNVHIRIVQQLCKNGRIKGASRLGREWMIPKDAEKPADMRYKSQKRAKRDIISNTGD